MYEKGEAEEELWGCSSSGTTGITANVIIGASKEENYIQTQNAADNKTHLAGPNYPLYGITIYR